MVRNPHYPEKISYYSLEPNCVDAFSFISKNYRDLVSGEPGMVSAEELCWDYPCCFNYTITAYGKDVEPNVPSVDESISYLKSLSKMVGRRRITFNFNPILIWGRYDVEYHKMMFDYIAERVGPYAEWASTAFVTMYPKVIRNCPGARTPDDAERRELLYHMGWSSRKNGMVMTACNNGESGIYGQFGITEAPCMSLRHIAEVNDRRLISESGAVDECSMCGTCQHRDVGIYNTCYNSCLYCYANEDEDVAFRNPAVYDPRSPMLMDAIRGDEEISVSPVIRCIS